MTKETQYKKKEPKYNPVVNSEEDSIKNLIGSANYFSKSSNTRRI